MPQARNIIVNSRPAALFEDTKAAENAPEEGAVERFLAYKSHKGFHTIEDVS